LPKLPDSQPFSARDNCSVSNVGSQRNDPLVGREAFFFNVQLVAVKRHIGELERAVAGRLQDPLKAGDGIGKADGGVSDDGAGGIDDFAIQRRGALREYSLSRGTPAKRRSSQ